MSNREPLPPFVIQRIEHILAADWKKLSLLLDPGLRYVHATGVRHDKAEYLKFLSQRIQILAMEIQDHEIHTGEDVIFLTGRLKQTIVRPAEPAPVEVCSWITEVWRRNAQWQLCVFQSTRES